MAGTAIRIPTLALEVAQKIAKEEGKTTGKLIAEMIEEYQYRHFWSQFSARMDQIKYADPESWEEIQTEGREWDVALKDGLEEE